MTKKSAFEIIETTGDEIMSSIYEPENWFQSGKYPFIIGSKNSADVLTDRHLNEDTTVGETIEEALRIDVSSLFEDLKKDNLPPAFETEFKIVDFTGVWEESISPRELGLSYFDFIVAHRDISTGKLFKKCFMGVAPTIESWQVPAYVRFGGWNACPTPARHCAILHYWQEKHGAEIVSLTSDVIECRVKEPPQTETDCYELAWQQFAYCPDNVYQSTGTIGSLAAKLRKSDYWYFWWD